MPTTTVMADADEGERVFAKCYACHSLNAADPPLEGPPLDRIVGRDVSAVPGFAYSAAMRDFAVANPRWTPELLDRFLADPQQLVPDNDMAFFGINDPTERRALIAYLGRAPTR